MNDKQIKLKHAGGRPLIWKDPAVLKKLVDNYFENETKPTLSGLALALDIDRKTLFNYGEKDQFFPIVKNARDKIEKIYENILIYGDKPTGVIFALKNMTWRDNQAIDHTTNGKELPSPIYGGTAK